MALSNDLISQFVKVTNDATKINSETTVYGTAVEYENQLYVKLDGSEQLTPITSTADAKSGERVTVLIKDHTATITGNMSSPSARTDDVKDLGTQIEEFDIILADKVSTSELKAETARIDTLVSDNVTIKERLTATEADIGTLEADNVTIKEKLTANQASIENLEVNKLDAEVAKITYAEITDLEVTNANIHNLEADYGDFKELTTDNFTAANAAIGNLETTKLDAESAKIIYANIDFANITEAAVQKIFADSGIIKDLVVSGGYITGELVGVTIKGDLIEGGTVVADKLVIKGSDGLYYKLNTDGVTTEAEQTDYNSLNGSVITAKSITATKISVDDLVAFDATIGGFNITDSALYSGVKSSVGNTTTGVYLDKTGQVAFGDASNFVKYFKDTDGSWKLAISASSIAFGSSKTNVETVVNNLQTAVNTAQSSANTAQSDVNALKTRMTSAETAIEQNAEDIALRATKTEVTETLGGYYTKKEADAAIQLSATNITSTVSETYATKTALDTTNSNVSAAQTAADNAQADVDALEKRVGTAETKISQNSSAIELKATKTEVKTLSDNLTNNYYTKTQSDSNLTIKANEITSSVSETYQTKAAMSDYSTTAQMNSAISQKADSITTAVSNTYTTKNEFNALNIGGRNYIIDSDAWTSSGSTASGITGTVENGVLKIKTVSGNGNWQSWSKQNIIEDNFKEGDNFTFSIEIKCEEGSAGKPSIYFKSGLGYYAMIGTVSTEYSTLYYSGVWKDTNDIAFHFGWSGTVGTFYIRRIKFEHGNKPTDWTPAPEDMATDEQFNNLNSSVESLSSELRQTATDLMATFTSSTATLQSNIDSAIDQANTANAATDAKINEIRSWVRITNTPSLELGASNSNFQTVLTNDKLSFYNSGKEVAYISNQKLYITDATITNQLNFGSYAWIPSSNGHITLKYIG